MCYLRNSFGFTRLGRGACRGLAWVLSLALLVACGTARADGPDDQYLQVYKLIEKADALKSSGKVAQARTNYLEAQAALAKFQRDYPYWNPKLVAYRANYVTQKLAEPAEPPPGSTNAPKPGAGTSASPAAAQPQIKLLEPGAEPRKPLRLHPAAGDTQTLQIQMKMAMENIVAGTEAPPVKLPAITLTLDSTVKNVAENGDIAFEMVISDVAVANEPGTMPEVAEAMKKVFAGVKGASASGTVSSRGLGTGVVFKLAGGADPQARQLMEQMKELYNQLAPPLPEEAIGVGAKWEIKTPIKSEGMTVNQTATYELASLDQEQLTTRDTVLQDAANQKIQNPAMPKMKVDLVKMTSRGTGERTYDLTKLMPITGKGESHSETTMAMGATGQKKSLTSKLSLTLSLETR